VRDPASAAQPLIGRERELDMLEVLARQTCAGRGSIVIVHGDAGIGKSALARAAASRGAELGMVTGYSRSDELTRSRPFGAVLDAMRRVAELDPSWAALAGRLRNEEPVDTLDACPRRCCRRSSSRWTGSSGRRCAARCSWCPTTCSGSIRRRWPR
jgi:hypothetical protein